MYVKSTINMPLTLRAHSLKIIKWWVDASFATHGDPRGHTGATMLLGKGSIMGMSKKQKINTRSSTESELVGADDASPTMMWTIYFVEAQGFNVEESVLFQDNLRAMLLKRKGKKSSSKRKKHINIRYFFIKDRVANNELMIKHCPTAEMLADHFTKPLQGASFRKFRTNIQGIPSDASDADLGWKKIKGCDVKLPKVAKMMVPIPQEGVGQLAKYTGLRANDTLSKKRYDVTAHRSARCSCPSEAELCSRVAPRVDSLNPLRVAPPYSGRSYALAVSGAQ
jgi:hypothetical protein